MNEIWTGAGQSALRPAGEQAARIADLWWLMFWLGLLVLVGVTVALVVGVARSSGADRDSQPPPDTERGRLRVIGSAVAVSLLILIVVFVASFRVDRAGHRLARQEATVIELVGHQWWWEVGYLDAGGRREFTTANEIHLPVGRPVRLLVRSRDVIHSVWIPPLHGKIDLLPDRTNRVTLRAMEAGTYRGACAEFCGLQHAKMALLVVAEPPAEYDVWLAAQRQPARPPADSLALAGLRIFESATCAPCHTVRGTRAQGRVGPDLTHLATRRTLAAGTLPRNPGTLGAWILDPQGIKPGNRMPPTTWLSPESLTALLHYLATLD